MSLHLIKLEKSRLLLCICALMVCSWHCPAVESVHCLVSSATQATSICMFVRLVNALASHELCRVERLCLRTANTHVHACKRAHVQPAWMLSNTPHLTLVSARMPGRPHGHSAGQVPGAADVPRHGGHPHSQLPHLRHPRLPGGPLGAGSKPCLCVCQPLCACVRSRLMRVASRGRRPASGTGILVGLVGFCLCGGWCDLARAQVLVHVLCACMLVRKPDGTGPHKHCGGGGEAKKDELPDRRELGQDVCPADWHTSHTGLFLALQLNFC